MGNMFSFMNDMDNYESRKVDRFEQGEIFVDTAKVSDGIQPFETAVAHPRYHDGLMIIVEAYKTVGEASKGHDKWVKIMTSEELPPVLKDCGNAFISSFGEKFGLNMEFPIDKEIVEK